MAKPLTETPINNDLRFAAKKRDLVLLQALEQVAPGTPLREAIDHIIAAKTGGLIVIGDKEHIQMLCNGGFEINCPFYPQKLYELAKMDGAIILSDDATRILKANVHLVPNPLIESNETGMRHRTAERVAKQTKALVISISQRRDRVSIYRDNINYVLEDVRVVISKANQGLSTLEKYRNRFDQVILNLNSLEIEDMVTLVDVTQAIERAEMLRRVSEEVGRYIVELGQEGRLIALQRDELMANVEEEYASIIRDYIKDPKLTRKAFQRLRDLSSEKLLDHAEIGELFGFPGDEHSSDFPMHPHGFRLLNKVPRVPSAVVEKIVQNFTDFQSVINATIEELDDVEGVGAVRAKAIQEGIRKLKGTSAHDRYI